MLNSAKPLSNLRATLRPTAWLWGQIPKNAQPHEQFLYHVQEIERLWAKLTPEQRRLVNREASVLQGVVKGVRP